jgi:hypothetical protein
LRIPSYSTDFDKGLTATNNVDLARAFKEFNSLAEQKLASTQYYLGQL